MEAVAILAFIFVGAIAGLSGGLLGLSGGVITVPCLVLIFHFMGFPQYFAVHAALGTSLAAMVINGAASVIAHERRKSVMWDLVLSAIPGLFLGCLLGSYFAHFMSGVLLQILFGFFIAILGAYFLLGKKKPRTDGKHIDKTTFTWMGLCIGTLASMLGIGGGVFIVPFLLSHHYSTQKAVGTSAATSLLITSLAAISYLYFGLNEVDFPWHIGYIYLPAFALIGVTTAFMAPLGAKLAHSIESKHLKKIFAATLILVGVLMIFS